MSSNLPPKEILGTIPSVGEWFDGYNATNPESSTGYYYATGWTVLRLSDEIVETRTMSRTIVHGKRNADPGGQRRSIPPSMIGREKSSGTLNISGGDVVIYVTSYGEVAQAASLLYGPRFHHQHRLRLVPDAHPGKCLGCDRSGL